MGFLREMAIIMVDLILSWKKAFFYCCHSTQEKYLKIGEKRKLEIEELDIVEKYLQKLK